MSACLPVAYTMHYGDGAPADATVAVAVAAIVGSLAAAIRAKEGHIVIRRG